MAKINKRNVDAAEVREKDYFVWDDELPGFGLRVFASGKRSYLVQYRALGRTRRFTIGLHGVWTPEMARKEAKVLLGRIAQGENPAEERQLDHKSITVKELCDLYLKDLEEGLILGKGGRPKRSGTIVSDKGRIHRHIVPLIGTRRVKDLTKADVTKVLKDVMAGKTRRNVKTKTLRGRSIVKGGAGTASRTVGLLGGILTYAKDAGIIEVNPAAGVKKPKDQVRTRRLTESEYRRFGEILNDAGRNPNFSMTVEIARLIALTGARRSEIIGLEWSEFDADESCLRLNDSKEGAFVRPIGLRVIDRLESLRPIEEQTFVFRGIRRRDQAFGGFPRQWRAIFKGTELEWMTPHVLRHSFASLGNDLGFTEATISAIVGHSRNSVTSKYIHTLDTALIMAADTISGYIAGLLDGMLLSHTSYALDRMSRQAALSRFLGLADGDSQPGIDDSSCLPMAA